MTPLIFLGNEPVPDLSFLRIIRESDCTGRSRGKPRLSNVPHGQPVPLPMGGFRLRYDRSILCWDAPLPADASCSWPNCR